MNGFNIVEIVTSIISAFIYGMIFSILPLLLRLISTVLGLFNHSVVYSERAEGSSKLDAVSQLVNLSSLQIFISVALFGIGFVTLSYIFLDGSIRLYTLSLALLGLYVSNITFVKVASFAFTRVLIFIFRYIEICKNSFCGVIHRVINRLKKLKKQKTKCHSNPRYPLDK